ncbi:MAG: hypothetical protein JXC33_12440 [Deltaproteobacteria bacterium]|nr:hypothetical protein [Deltaproteobacteria bacterium]
MNKLSRDIVKTLMEKQEGLCVSIFMPTHRRGTETQQNQIRFKNLLRKTEEKLMESDLRPQEAREFLKPAQELLGEAPFWQNQSDGLALFLSALSLDFFRLPINFDELVIVTDRFHIKPLIPVISGDINFYIVALTQKNAKLIKCNRYSAEEVDLENIPESLAELFRFDVIEKEPQFHTRMHPAAYQGHGGGSDDPKDDVLRYFQQVDRGLRTLIQEKNLPLVFAGVDYLYPIYKEANTYSYLADKWISGSPEGSSVDDLHGQAWDIVEPFFEAEKEEALQQYKLYSGTGRASTDIKEIVQAAYHGRAGILFVALGLQQWGIFDQDTDEVLLQQGATFGNTDLLDFAAVRTISNGGTVYAVNPKEVPDEAPMAAVFRY